MSELQHNSGTRKIRRYWTLNEEKLLLKAWSKRYPEMQKRKTSKFYEEILNELKEHSCNFVLLEVMVKIQNIARKYRSQRFTPDLHTTWPLYDEVHKILGAPTNNNNVEEQENGTQTNEETTNNNNVEEPENITLTSEEIKIEIDDEQIESVFGITSPIQRSRVESNTPLLDSKNSCFFEATNNNNVEEAENVTLTSEEIKIEIDDEEIESAFGLTSPTQRSHVESNTPLLDSIKKEDDEIKTESPIVLNSPLSPPLSSNYEDSFLSPSSLTSENTETMPCLNTNNNQENPPKLLEDFQKLQEKQSYDISGFMRKLIENDERMLQIETERNELLKEFVYDTKQFRNAFLAALNKKPK